MGIKNLKVKNKSPTARYEINQHPEYPGRTHEGQC